MRVVLLVLVLITSSACEIGPQSRASASPEPTPRPRALARADLLSALENATRSTFKISYSLNGKINGVAYSGRWNTYQRPPLKRVEIFDGSTTLNVYFTDGTALVCGVPLTLPCRSMTIEEAQDSTLAGIEDMLRANASIFDTAELSEDRVAGQDVTCFKARPDDVSKLEPGARRILACYTSQGLPMRIEFSSPEITLMLEGILLLKDFPEADVRAPAGAAP